MRLMSVVSALLVLWLVPPAHAFQGAGSAPVDETEPVAVPEATWTNPPRRSVGRLLTSRAVIATARDYRSPGMRTMVMPGARETRAKVG